MEIPPNEIKDFKTLFMLSGMVDQIRDTTARMLRVDVDRVTLETTAERYLELRTRIAENFDGDALTGLDITPVIDPASVTIYGLHAAAAALSRWSDLVNLAPGTLVAWHNAQMQIQAQGAQLPPILASPALAIEAGPAALTQDSARVGMYL